MMFIKNLANAGVKLISTNTAKRSPEAVSASRKDEYYKNLGEAKDNNNVKPPGWDEALPYESIPGPKPLPIVGNMWRFLPLVGEYYNVPLKKINELFHEKYGNTVVLKQIPGRPPMVFIFDVTDIEKIFRNDGPFPVRQGTVAITHYRTVTRKDIFQGVGGLLTAHGENWFKVRSVVNPILMQSRIAQQYIGKMDKVANELLENIRYFSEQNENKEMPENFQNELYKWALESIGVIALDKHLGCLNLNAPKDSEAQNLITRVNEIFLLMYTLEIHPPIWKIIETPTWKRFVDALDFITQTTLKYIDEAMNKSAAENTPEDQLSVTQRLAKEDRKIALAMAMDMLIAGIDTTGKTIAATLYFMAKNPEKQQLLREEILKNLPEKESPVTSEVLKQSPYLKAAIKESTRIAPIATSNARTTTKDLVLGGYRIPKNTEIVTMNLYTSNSDQFKEPHKFIPERWLRTTEDEYSHKHAHPFAYLPFGFGPRSCVGRRFANLELEVVLSKIVRNFELSWPHEDMTFSGTFLYGIDGPLKLKVKPL